MKKSNTLFLLNFAIVFAMLGLFQQKANATASFARATGASCNKCHTANFPRLTVKGEKFMLNGFQVKKESDTGFGLDDDETTPKKHKFALPKLPEMLSVTGQLNPIEVSSNNSTPAAGSPEVVTVVAAGSLMKDMPIWAGIDVGNEGASVHRYQMGLVNIADSKLFNLRMGTIDPTTWTSFYGHGAALESASSGIGSYGSGHGGNTGFVTVGSGYAERNGMEYYGYTRKLLWSFGTSNASGHDGGGANDPFDYWLTTRYEFMKKSTVSFLWYNANGAVENQTYTTSANIRLGKLDLLGQFSFDNTGGKVVTDTSTKTVRDKWGLTIQANYETTKKSMGIIRYDSTDNGEKTDSTESQLTMALVFKPEQNIKITASYVMELKAVGDANATASDGHDHAHKPSARAAGHEDTTEGSTEEAFIAFGDHFKLNIRYMF